MPLPQHFESSFFVTGVPRPTTARMKWQGSAEVIEEMRALRTYVQALASTDEACSN
jgi:hypothetical protein